MTIYRDSYGNEIELPKYTIALKEKFEKLSEIEAVSKETLKARYELMKSILSPDYVSEVLDGTTFDEIDVIELDKLFFGVKNAYEVPLQKDQLDSAISQLEEIMPLLEKYERIVANSGSKPTRQGFTRIK